MKLRAKILLLIIPLVVIPLLTLGWLAYNQLRNTTIQRSLGQMDTLINQVRMHLEYRQQTALANINLFSRSSQLMQYVTNEDEEERFTLMQSSILRLFGSYQKAYPDYYEIRFLLPDGFEDTRSLVGDIPNITDEEAGSEFFAEIRRHENETRIMYGQNPDNQEVAMLVSKPLILNNRAVGAVNTPPTLRGYLVITANMDFLHEQATTMQIGKYGYLFFTDQKGKVLFHPEQARMGKTLEAAEFSALQRAIDQKTPVQTRLNGTEVNAQGAQLHPNLYLFTVLPEYEIRAASNRLGVLVATTILTATLVTLLLIYAALKSLLLKPIQQLSSAANEMGRGQLLAHIPVESSDEIGTLAKSIRAMGKNLQNSQQQTEYLAYHDTLTGLPNRLMFNEMHRQALAEAKRHQHMSALMYLDLDDFKRINDTLGHQAGDLLLKEISQRLLNVLRGEDCLSLARQDVPTDMVARLGGDEFTILLTHVVQSHEPAMVAKRLLSELGEPVMLGGHEVKIGSSIGITLYPDDGQDTETLNKNADIALYHAKREGKNNYQFYSASMNRLTLERMALETKLRHALERDQLSLMYQPQVDLGSGEVVGLEALLRWEDQEQGFIPPATFIPIAEESGLIIPLGEWVLKTACSQNRAWQQAGLKPITVSVNISGLQLSQQNLQAVVATTLRESGLASEYLELELTETNLLKAQDQAALTLGNLKQLGVEIALDDFGTGYSSLSYLKRLPISHLKIDYAFVRDIHTDSDDAAIVAAIIAMAGSLGLRVTAEGVEHIEQLDFLRERNCDAIQGFLFSEPLSVDEVEWVLRDGLQLSEDYFKSPADVA